jgi:hypothetical protein
VHTDWNQPSSRHTGNTQAKHSLVAYTGLVLGFIGLGIGAITWLPTTLSKLVGFIACVVVAVAATKAIFDRDRSLPVSNWLLGLLALATVTTLALVMVLAFEVDARSGDKQNANPSDHDSEKVWPPPDETSDSSQSTDPFEPPTSTTSSPPSTTSPPMEPNPTGQYGAPSRHQIALPSPEPAYDHSEADLDIPESGEFVAGNDIELPGRGYPNLTGEKIAPAQATEPTAEACATLAREQPTGSADVDEFVPGTTAFCVITDKGSVAYLKFTGRRSGKELEFALTLWRPN